MPTRNVVITDRQAELIDQLVASGEYQNASEVLREGLQLVKERRAAHAAKLEALRAALQVGVDAADRGDYITFSDAKSLRSHLRKIGEKAIKDERKR